ncbi:MAG: hypothetical protein ACFFAS_16860 [Promethearchaeota archaeon]
MPSRDLDVLDYLSQDEVLDAALEPEEAAVMKEIAQKSHLSYFPTWDAVESTWEGGGARIWGTLAFQVRDRHIIELEMDFTDQHISKVAFPGIAWAELGLLKNLPRLTTVYGYKTVECVVENSFDKGYRLREFSKRDEKAWWTNRGRAIAGKLESSGFRIAYGGGQVVVAYSVDEASKIIEQETERAKEIEKEEQERLKRLKEYNNHIDAFNEEACIRLIMEKQGVSRDDVEQEIKKARSRARGIGKNDKWAILAAGRKLGIDLIEEPREKTCAS